MQLKYPLSSNLMTHMIYVTNSLKAIMRRCGITITQYRVLAFLIRSKTEQTPSALAAGLRMSQSSISSALDGLLEKEAVVIVPDEADRRARLVVLTAEGESLAADAELEAAAFVRRFWTPLNQEQRDTILEGCAKNDVSIGPAATRGVEARGIMLYMENAVAVSTRMSEVVRGFGISVGEFRVLFELRGKHGGAQPSQIAYGLCMRPNEVSRVLDSLARKDYVHTDAAHDRRSLIAEITTAGYDVVRRCAVAVDAMYGHGLYETTPEERHEFSEVADLVVGNLRRG